MKLLACMLFLAVATAAAAASAQRAARPLSTSKPLGIIFQSEVGKTTGNTSDDDRLTQAAIFQVEQSLRQLGYQVLPRADVVQQLVQSGIVCPKGVQNCEPDDVLRALDLGGVVLIAIWWSRTPADITIEITSADAVGTAKGTLDANVDARVPALVTSALQDLKNGKAVEVQINTLPLGAEVRLDGQFLGIAPVRARSRPGSHEIIASYPDYVTTSQHFEVPRGAEGPMPVHIALEREGEHPGRATLEGSEATPAWDYAIGAGLGVTGIVLAIAPMLTLARDGECADGTNNVFCERVGFGTGTGFQLAGSVLALAGATWLFISTPIQATISTDGDYVHARLSGSF